MKSVFKTLSLVIFTVGCKRVRLCVNKMNGEFVLFIVCCFVEEYQT